jgi:hypothetical protein
MLLQIFLNICTVGSSCFTGYNSTTFLIVTHLYKLSRALMVCSCFIYFFSVPFKDAVKNGYYTALIAEARIRVRKTGGMTLTKEYMNTRGGTCSSAALPLTCFDSGVENTVLRYCYVSFPTFSFRFGTRQIRLSTLLRSLFENFRTSLLM